MLEGLTAPYSATAVERLLANGAVPVGKTNLDEFGMGSSGDLSAFGPTNNPWDHERVAGGSSGGSAAAVAAGLVPFALGSDTGGSVRQPASFCGVYGLKPTYGVISRYGLVAYASSLESVGILSRDAATLRTTLAAMAGTDAMDQTSVAPPQGSEVWLAADRSSKTYRIAVLGGELSLSAAVRRAYDTAIDSARAAGHSISEVQLSSADYYVPVYYTIAMAEASANLARFNGVRYGRRPIYSESPEQLVRNARGAGFGDEVKLRVLLGTYVLRSGFQDQYYQRAQRIRTAISRELESLWQQHDLLLLPVFPVQAFRHDEPSMDALQQKMADKFTTVANLSGMPALSIPVEVIDGLPAGIQAMGPRFSEPALISFAEQLARSHPPATPPDAGEHWRLFGEEE